MREKTRKALNAETQREQRKTEARPGVNPEASGAPPDIFHVNEPGRFVSG
jgi:hypothetical protein